MLRDRHFGSFASFSIVLITPFINELSFLISSIFSFEIINIDLEIWTFFWMEASVADAPAVNTNGIKTVLANELDTFSLMVTPF